tara:strand:- start:20487 stop:21431 length:945 start_codon:yes stop_codon:yes gene_type:complete
MNENEFIDKQDQIDREVSLTELFNVLWIGKKLILAFTSLFMVIAIIYSLVLPNIYQSKALLSPVNTSGGLGTAFDSLSGLATFSGINLQSKESTNITLKALEKLNSLSFFSENILPNIYLPNLMAVRSWDSKNNTIHYDKNIFDESSKKWVRDFSFPHTQIPSAQESYEEFLDEHLEISEDKKSGFISIAINHQSPHIAKAWVELIVQELNNFFISKDKTQAQAAIDYLNKQIAQTGFAEVKEVIAQLLQNRIRDLSLIEVSDFYILEYIDPPAVMEEKSEPSRILILIFGTILGSVLGATVVLFRHYFNKKIK